VEERAAATVEKRRCNCGRAACGNRGRAAL
jgi:hypothetical protein